MSNHDPIKSAQRALEIIAIVSPMIPPCPNCGKLCSGWVQEYIKQVLSAYTDPIGPMAMLSTIVGKAGKDGIFVTRSDLEQHGASGLVFRAGKDGDSYQVQTLSVYNPTDRAEALAKLGLEDDTNLGTVIVIKDEIG